MIYTGIGARKLPELMYRRMVWLGEVMANKGYTLRSGAADGADSAFEEGCDNVGGQKEIFLPWKQFNKHPSELYEPPKQALNIAKLHHPNWNALTSVSKKFMARNSQQVLGELLYEPTDLVICWTPDGVETGGNTKKTTGGTGMAIRIASYFDIPIFNLKNEGSMERLVEFLKEVE